MCSPIASSWIGLSAMPDELAPLRQSPVPLERGPSSQSSFHGHAPSPFQVLELRSCLLLSTPFCPIFVWSPSGRICGRVNICTISDIFHPFIYISASSMFLSSIYRWTVLRSHHFHRRIVRLHFVPRNSGSWSFVSVLTYSSRLTDTYKHTWTYVPSAPLSMSICY
jgi:hypothetical protein